MSEEVNEDKLLDDRDGIQFISENYVEYSKYCTRTRNYPNIYDGMKESYRHLIYGAKNYNKHLVKANTVIGEVMKYTVHGDSSIDGVLVNATCRFNYFPLFKAKGNWGGRGYPSSSPRYRECQLSDYAVYMYLELVDYADWIDGEAGLPEPLYLPSLLPYSLIMGTTSIPVGMPVPNIVPLNFMQLIDFYIDTLKKSKIKHYPLPDVGDCYIDLNRVDTLEVVRTGAGRLWFKPKMHTEGDDTVVLTSRTPNRAFGKAVDALNWYIDNDYVEYYDESDTKKDIDRHVFKIADFSQISLDDLYKKVDSAMSHSSSYNFIFERDGNAVEVGLDEVVKSSLEYYRKCQIRKFQKDLEKVLYKLEILKAIEALRNSPKFKDIPKMTRDELIRIIIDLGFSEDTAKNVVTYSITYLTKSHKDELPQLQAEADKLSKLIDDPTEYIISKYVKLKEMLAPLYASRKHTILLENSNKHKLASLDGDNIVINDDNKDGVDFSSRLMLISEEGWIKPLSLDNSVDQVASMIIDGYKYDMIASDKHKYLVALYSTGISVIKTSSVKSDHLLYKIKDEWKGKYFLNNWISTDAEEVDVVTKSGKKIHVKLSDYIKSRVGQPSWISKEDLVDIKE